MFLARHCPSQAMAATRPDGALPCLWQLAVVDERGVNIEKPGQDGGAIRNSTDFGESQARTGHSGADFAVLAPLGKPCRSHAVLMPGAFRCIRCEVFDLSPCIRVDVVILDVIRCL